MPAYVEPWEIVMPIAASFLSVYTVELLMRYGGHPLHRLSSVRIPQPSSLFRLVGELTHRAKRRNRRQRCGQYLIGNYSNFSDDGSDFLRLIRCSLTFPEPCGSRFTCAPYQNLVAYHRGGF